MGAIIVVLAIIGAVVLFAYLKFPPPYATKKLVDTFNFMTLGVCAFLCLAFFLNLRSDWIGTINDKWWLPMGILGVLGIEIVFLGICFLLRNFWIFKPPRRPGSGFGF